MRSEYKKSTPEMPLVTIITVVYNGEKSLEQTILSVLHQEYQNIEYIIIDGGSTDTTLDIVKKYEDNIDYWVSERDQGIYDAMNKGIGLSNGELIGLLNSDDFYESGAIQSIIDMYKKERVPCILYGNTFILMEDLGIRYKFYAHMNYWRGMGFHHPAMFVHRDVYESVGKYTLQYKLASDYDFMLRAILNKVIFVYVDTFLVNYRHSGLSATQFSSSLLEYRVISKKYFSFFSREHLIFLCLFIKSMALIVLQKIIQLFGEDLLKKARAWYIKKFIAGEYEPHTNTHS